MSLYDKNQVIKIQGVEIIPIRIEKSQYNEEFTIYFMTDNDEQRRLIPEMYKAVDKEKVNVYFGSKGKAFDLLVVGAGFSGYTDKQANLREGYKHIQQGSVSFDNSGLK